MSKIRRYVSRESVKFKKLPRMCTLSNAVEILLFRVSKYGFREPEVKEVAVHCISWTAGDIIRASHRNFSVLVPISVTGRFYGLLWCLSPK
jgi:hypothetical protein